MAKFAILFFAALAFQASFAEFDFYRQNLKNVDVQDLGQQIRSSTRDVASGVSVGKEHLMYSTSNEFSHNIHDVAYHLQHALRNVEAGETRDLLKQAVVILSGVVHQVEQATHNEPAAFRTLFKAQIELVPTAAEKLVQIVRKEHAGTDNVVEEIEDALDDLLNALQQINVRTNLEEFTQEEIKSQIQSLTNQAVNTVHRVNTNDEDVVEDLVHHVRHYGHHLGDVVHRLEKEVRNHNIHDGQVKNVLQQVTSKLGQIRSSIEQIGHGQNYGSLEKANRHSQIYNLLNKNARHTEDNLDHVHDHTQEHLDRMDRSNRIGGNLLHFHDHTQEHLNRANQQDILPHSHDHTQERLDRVNYQDVLPHFHDHTQEHLGRVNYQGILPHFHDHTQERLDRINQDNEPHFHDHTQDNLNRIVRPYHTGDNLLHFHDHTQKHLDRNSHQDNVHHINDHTVDNLKHVSRFIHLVRRSAGIGFDRSTQDVQPGLAGYGSYLQPYTYGSYQPIGQYYQGRFRGVQTPTTSVVVQKIETILRGVADQLERLFEAVRTVDVKEHEGQKVKDLVHSVLARTFVATYQLQRRVERIVHPANRM